MPQGAADNFRHYPFWRTKRNYAFLCTLDQFITFNLESQGIFTIFTRKIPLFCPLIFLAECSKTEMFFKTYSAGSEDMFEVPLRGIRATKKFRARTKYNDRR